MPTYIRTTVLLPRYFSRHIIRTQQANLQGGIGSITIAVMHHHDHSSMSQHVHVTPSDSRIRSVLLFALRFRLVRCFLWNKRVSHQSTLKCVHKNWSIETNKLFRVLINSPSCANLQLYLNSLYKLVWQSLLLAPLESAVATFFTDSCRKDSSRKTLLVPLFSWWHNVSPTQ